LFFHKNSAKKRAEISKIEKKGSPLRAIQKRQLFISLHFTIVPGAIFDTAEKQGTTRTKNQVLEQIKCWNRLT
jgi:hypothetical protein